MQFTALKLFALPLSCLVLIACDSRIHTQTLGDGVIRYKLAGEGSPTIILEAGLGGDLESFDDVFDQISAQTRVFAYDRPGAGKSTRTERPRSFEQVNKDLRELLDMIGIDPPYVLVGHSLGGIYMLEYAIRYPDEVAALVLVDAPHPDFYAKLRELGIDEVKSELRYYSMPVHLRREYDAIPDMKLSGDLGDTPLIVMTAGSTARSENGPLVWKTQLELVELSTNGRHVFAEESGHGIQRDEPELLIECILDALEMARDGKTKKQL